MKDNKTFLKWSYVLTYAAIVVIILSLGYLFLPSLFISIPFLVIPFTFALHSSFSILNATGDYSLGIFFKNFTKYYTANFFGGYRLIHAFLKCLLFFLIIDEIVSLPYLIMEINRPEIIEMISSAQSYQEIYEIVINNTDYLSFSDISVGVALGVSSLEFIHHVITNSLKISYRIHSETYENMRQINFVHSKYVFRRFRKAFYKSYFKNMWYIYALYLLVYASAFILSYKYLGGTIDNVLALSLIIGFISVVPFSIHIFNVIEGEIVKHYKEYSLGPLYALLTSIESYLKSSVISDEDRVKMEEQKRQVLEDIEKINSIK